MHLMTIFSNNHYMQRMRNDLAQLTGLLFIASIVTGCGTTRVTLPQNNTLTADSAVVIIDSTIKANFPEWKSGEVYASKLLRADHTGWEIVDEIGITSYKQSESVTVITRHARPKKLFYKDIDYVSYRYTDSTIVCASIILLGLADPCFDGRVFISMKDGSQCEFKTIESGDLRTCAPIWWFSPKYTTKKTDRIAEAFEYMRIQSQQMEINKDTENVALPLNP